MQTPDDNTSNFQMELLQMLNDEINESDSVCLISNQPLEENPIKLACGHKFNYDSIFNEIKSQKNPNHLETQRLYHNELKCPYCRTVQKGLLPSRENYPNVSGVNWPKKYQEIISIRDQHIQSLEKYVRPSNAHWWAIGGFTVGAGAAIGIVYAVAPGLR